MKTQIILLEGISTSGKTTIQNLLKKYFEKKEIKALNIDEKETIGHLINGDKTLETSLKVMKKLILDNINKKYEYIVFDRFHLSNHGTIKESSFEDYKEIENLLSENSGKIIYLHVDKEKVCNRIKSCMKNRKGIDHEKWFKRVTKGANNSKEIDKTIYDFYENRINRHLEDIKKTRLGVLKIDVSEINNNLKEYEKTLPQIIKFIEK